MAVSTCAKCAGHTFERGLVTPVGERYEVSVLQCADCGTIVGMLDPHLARQTLRRRPQPVDRPVPLDPKLIRIVWALSP
jgi:hypothetical protein